MGGAGLVSADSEVKTGRGGPHGKRAREARAVLCGCSQHASAPQTDQALQGKITEEGQCEMSPRARKCHAA